MKFNSTPVIWALFFSITLIAFAFIAYFYIEPREIVVSDSQANIIGTKIAENELIVRGADMVAWHDAAKFSTLGISRLAWYPNDDNNASISFNGFLAFVSHAKTPPNWLIDVRVPPWNSQMDFNSHRHDIFKRQMRNFLQNNVSLQTQYLITILESSLPKMLKVIKNPFAKMHFYENFYHMSMQKNGTYALIDYLIFMGDGILVDQQYNSQGWGLRQILENINGDSDQLMEEFIARADLLLTRRVMNAPINEEKFLFKWRQRLQTYRIN